MAIRITVAKLGFSSTLTPGCADTKSTVRNMAAARCSSVLLTVPPAVCDNVSLSEASGGVAHRCQCFVHDPVERERDALDIHECQVAVERLPRVAEGGAWRKVARVVIGSRPSFSLCMPKMIARSIGLISLMSGVFSSKACSAERSKFHSPAVLGHCARWSMDSSHEHPSLHRFEGARVSRLRVFRAVSYTHLTLPTTD